MARLLGAALVAFGCAWIGFQAADGLRRQLRALRDMAGALAFLERELELGSPPLPQLMERAEAHSSGPARLLFEGCRRGLDHLDEEDMGTLWRRLVSERRELGEEGQEALSPLGDLLGRYDSRAQRESISGVRRRLEELADRGEEERLSRGRVYQVMGLSGGAFLVILLL